MKEICDSNLDDKVADCVLTVPAYYDEKARSAIMRSALLAGFNVKRLINEPTAAAFAYGLETGKRGNYFVYDLGGGTFDVSILKIKDGIFKVIGTGGDSSLGGDDFDELFARNLVKKNFNISFDDLEKQEKKKVIKQCKLFKEDLFIAQKITRDFFVKNTKKNIEIDIDILNSSIEPLLDQTIEIAKKLLLDSDFLLDDINGFILVGGSSRLAAIKEKIKKNFDVKIFDDINPDLVVSLGAALHGYELLNGSENLLLDVTPLSLGIETMGGLMEKIISRNTSIPVIQEQTFTTHENGQTSIKINVLQGERETSENNRSLGKFILDGLEPKPAGIPRVKVRFSLDADGILLVTAIDDSIGKENNLVVKTNHNINILEMKSMIESSIKNAKDDMAQRMLIESKVKAKNLINEILGVKKELNSISSKDDIDKINNLIDKLNKEIEMNDADKINNIIEELNNSTKNFAQKRIDKSFSKLVGKDLDFSNDKDLV